MLRHFSKIISEHCIIIAESNSISTQRLKLRIAKDGSKLEIVVAWGDIISIKHEESEITYKQLHKLLTGRNLSWWRILFAEIYRLF